jgi:hypothetical protein
MALALSRISFLAIIYFIEQSSTYFGMPSTGTLVFQLLVAQTVNTTSAQVALERFASLAE